MQGTDTGETSRPQQARREALGDQAREQARRVLVQAGRAKRQPIDADVTGGSAVTGAWPAVRRAGGRVHRGSSWPGRTTTPCFSSSRRAAAST